MERNSDIRLFIATNVSSPSRTTALADDLKKLGYAITESQETADYLVIDDAKDGFDINFYRKELKTALMNDQPVILLSAGIPFFMECEGGRYFTHLRPNIYRGQGTKILIDYHVDNFANVKTAQATGEDGRDFITN